MKYSRALEFMGEVRGGISWEAFSEGAVSNFEALLELWTGTEEARLFLSKGEIPMEYIERQVPVILQRLHCNEERNPYLTLGLPRGATPKEIKKRWKDLMLLYHPDRNRDKEALECAKRINEAYTVLRDPLRRMRYDASRAEGAQGLKGEAAAVYGVHARGKPSMKSGVAAKAVRCIIPVSAVVSALLIFVILRDNRPLMGAGAEPQAARAQRQQAVTEQPERDLRAELSLFLGGYIRAYEEGDAEGVASYYSASAIENNRMDIREIRRTYGELLGGRRFRYRLRDIDFHPQGESIFVSASYVIDRLDTKNSEYPLKGRIRWVLSREKEGLKIVRLDYDRN